MLTPLSQAALTSLVALMLREDGGFKEAVETVFHKKNFKSEDEAFEALKRFWTGNSSFSALFSIFLSRGEIESLVYQEGEGENQDREVVEDEEVKKFISSSLEEKCKNYPLVYPYLGDAKKNLESFTFHRPALLKRTMTTVRARVNTEVKNAHYHIFYDPFDLFLPPTVRAAYVRRLISGAGSNFRGEGRLLLPLHVVSELDDVSRSLKQMGESVGGRLLESEEDFVDPLIRAQITQASTRLFQSANRIVYSYMERLADAFVQNLVKKYEKDHEGFTRAIWNVMDLAFYSSMAFGGTFFVISAERPADREEYAAVLAFSLVLLQILLEAEAAVSFPFLSQTIATIYRGGTFALPQTTSAVGRVVFTQVENFAIKYKVDIQNVLHPNISHTFSNVFPTSSIAGLLGDNIVSGRREGEEGTAPQSSEPRRIVHTPYQIVIKGFTSSSHLSDFLKRISENPEFLDVRSLENAIKAAFAKRQ